MISNARVIPRAKLSLRKAWGEERLTQDQIYSDSLHQKYSAIYRSIDEYRIILTEVFEPEFRLVSEGKLFDASLHNRKESTDYYLIWKK